MPGCNSGNDSSSVYFPIISFLTFLFHKKCWKSRVRDAYGVERVSRGCTVLQDHLLLVCNQNTNNNIGGPRKRHTYGQYNIECCTGDYCNSGSFPELPPIIYTSSCG